MADKYPHHDVLKLKGIPFIDVLDHLGVRYRRQGGTYLTECVFHDDEHPSLVVYQTSTQNHCHCFACGNGGDTISYVMAHFDCDFNQACLWLEREFGIISGTGTPVNLKRVGKTLKPKHYAYIPLDFLTSRISMDSSFCKMLCHIYPKEDVERVVEQYRLGIYAMADFSDDVMFASIDVEGRIHNIKLQNYCHDPTSEQFGHCYRNHCMWLGKLLARQGVVPAESEFDNECLFGAHLLPLRPDDNVILVESPKNAVIGAIEQPWYVWVAAGNKGALKPRVLECLRGRSVAVYPDRDAIVDWRETLSEMMDITHFHVSDFCERAAPANEPKYDIADYFLHRRKMKQ